MSSAADRGGGDRNDKHLYKACALNALQPATPANWNKRNKMIDLFVRKGPGYQGDSCTTISGFESGDETATADSIFAKPQRLCEGISGTAH